MTILGHIISTSLVLEIMYLFLSSVIFRLFLALSLPCGRASVGVAPRGLVCLQCEAG